MNDERFSYELLELERLILRGRHNADKVLDMKDADLAFGPKGAIVFAGGTGDISNCKFSYSRYRQ